MASLPLPTGSALAVPLPHSLTPSPRPPLSSSSIGKHIAVAAGLGIGVGMAVAPQFAKQRDLLARNLWEFFTQRREPRDLLDRLACMSLATEVGHMDKIVVEPSSGASFPAVLNETKQLAGIGLRRRSILGLKNVDVYAFGLYADESSMKEMLGDKYGKLSAAELKDNEEFFEDVMENDLCLTVRLEIVYGNLSIGTVRSAFKESVGSRLQKFSGSQNEELLQRFTSQFKDEYKLSRGTIIDLTRLQGHVLQTKIDDKEVGTIHDKEVGTIQSQLLCRSLFDLYIGKDPFDKPAKENIGLALASLISK